MNLIFTHSKKIFLVVSLLFSSLESYSTETPAILREWAAYSGISDSTFKTPVLTENDYTYVATIEENTVSGADIVVIKYNNNGIAIWKQSWTGAGLGRDQAADMVMDSLYLYICGTTFSSATNFDYVVIKMQKANGALEWTQTFNGTANNYDIATAIAINDSSIYVTGVTSSLNTLLDYHTLKYHINGTLLWSLDFDYNNLMDIPFAISYSQEDSNIIVTGGSQSSIYDWDYQTNIYKYNGTTVDLGRVSGTSVGFDRATAVKTDSLGNIYITGAARENNSNFDIKTVKLDKLGNLIWQRTYDNNGGNDIANDLVVNNDGEIYLVGTIEGNGSDYLVMRLEASNGGIVWQNTIDCGANDTARAICFDSHGNIVITGQAFNPENSNYDFLTVNFDRAGQELWRDYFDGPDHGDDNATNIASDNDGNIFVTGQTWVGNDYHSVTIKYKTDFFTQPPAVDTPSVAYLFYPNSGQLVNTNDSLVTDSVHYYTLHHSPQLYFGYGMMNMVWSHVDDDTTTADTLQRVDVTFANSNNPTEAYPIDEDTSSYLNYFLGHCPNGITNVHGSASLLFTDVYPDIDVLYSSNNAGLKLLFIINPGASIPQEMGLAFAGDNGVSVLNNWGLNVHTTLGDYEFEKPHVYQIDTSGNRVALPWHLNWNIVQNGEAGFTGWGSYDNNLPIVIEISKQLTINASIVNGNLIWSAFYGGTGGENCSDIIDDSSGDIYAVGTASTIDFPITPGNYTFNAGKDSYIIKFDNLDHRAWALLYGGSLDDVGNAIAVDDISTSGGIYITGFTNSNNLPVSSGNLNGVDPFIAKFDLGGTSRIWSKFISDNGAGTERGVALCIAKNGKVYCGGTLSGNSFNLVTPGTAFVESNPNSFTKGFICQFDLSGTVEWSTYFGGNNSRVSDLKILEDKLFVAGVTAANNYSNNPCNNPTNDDFPGCDPGSSAYFQSASGGQGDAYIAEFGFDRKMKWSSFVGGSNVEEAHVKLDLKEILPGNKMIVHMLGTSHSSGPPFNISNGISGCYNQMNSSSSFVSDIFLFRFEDRIPKWSTYFGGFAGEEGLNISHTKNGNNDNTEDGELFIFGSTLTQTGQNNSNFCQIPLNGDFPLCHSNSNYFFEPNFQSFSSNPRNLFLASFDYHTSNINWSTFFAQGGGTTNNIFTSNAALCSSINSQLYLGCLSENRDANDYPISIPTPGVSWPQSVNNNIVGAQTAVFARFDLSNVVSVSETEDFNNEFIIYPNPSLEKVNIKIQINSLSIVIIELFDIVGRKILSYTYNRLISTYSDSFDTSKLTPGVYIFQVKVNNRIMTKKLIHSKCE